MRGEVHGLERSDASAIVEAVRAVSRAEIVPRFRSLDPAEIEAKSGPDDLVTLADRRAEAASPTPWDHAAGSLVMREVGGCAITPSGERYEAAGRDPLIAADTEANARRLVEVLGLVSPR